MKPLFSNKMFTILFRRLPKHSTTRLLNAAVIANKRRFANASNVISSSIPDIEIPYATIPEFVFKNVDKFPNKTAVECAVTGRKYTYEELRAKSRNLNRALRKKLKLRKGDVVAILLPNVPEYPICLLGALEAGLIVTTINPLYTAEEIKRQLVDANVRAIITLGMLWNTTKAAVKLMPNQIPIITIKSQESESLPQGSINFKELTDTKCDIEDIPPGDPNTIVLLPYSSGTTGLPKGVEHTHLSLVANICQRGTSYLAVTQETTDTHQDIVPAVLPWFHIYGLAVVLLGQIHNMSKIVSLPQFTPDLFINTLSNHKPNALYLVPPLVLLMSNHPSVKKEHFQSVRVICSGAAPLGAKDEEKLLQKAEKSVNVIQGYGLTEAPVTLLASSFKKAKHGLIGSVGEILPNTLAKVVPAENVRGEPFGPNKSGELLLKGPQVMIGYHNKPKETEETFVDGWLRTGDLVYYDDNEIFYVTDRLKELIKVKGFQVAPAELEEIIRSYPEVADAAVIGIPHATHGEVPRAYVVPKQNVKLNVEKLEQYVADQVATYKQIKGGVSIVGSIPKTASGKILRKELKLQYEKETR